MVMEIPQYGLRAYALFYSKHGSKESFSQNELEWVVGQSMKKKIFALLLNSGWIKKKTRTEYLCAEPDKIIKELLDFKINDIIKQSKKEYVFTNLSAVEIWSDYSYVQRGMEKSPYFIKVLRKDLAYWKNFFNKNNIPNYISEGSTIGEYVILIPVTNIEATEKEGLKVETLKQTLKIAKANEMYSYAYNYMRKKYGPLAS